jgi:hypothetical protein
MVDEVAMGHTLTELSGRADLPSTQEFLVALARDPLLMRAFNSARELSAYTMEDEALFLLRQAQKTEGKGLNQLALRALDMLVTQLRWSAEKRNARVYSPKASADAVVPVVIQTSLNLGADGGGASADGHANVWALEARTQIAVAPRKIGDKAADPIPLEEVTSPKPRRQMKRVLTPQPKSPQQLEVEAHLREQRLEQRYLRKRRAALAAKERKEDALAGPQLQAPTQTEETPT